ncbi:uncharacterized protein LACBIDRAFT_296055 [Laccaria bicolor S238N-H82]|uniref:Predicted protein n=1 Tax=Laccaria bicolor (strain S238N-H82 / ATCC MYA-4686) TaxID=486041 RepID=B0E310_LACBS|nr:uncharacterized protein LACBIDRAFT_296055 [Laccaria bicolor S238N-H82]EDQ98774.1 predicted protein [Laccaria bicolor S238N-H82]|eukprot:XP_001890580.1 predicted protein [Laccaria bicolor S238N-H82]
MLLTAYTLGRSQVAWSPLGFKRSATLRVPLVESQRLANHLTNPPHHWLSRKSILLNSWYLGLGLTPVPTFCI